MTLRKGCSPLTRIISDELLSLERNWYVLTTSICGGSTPRQYFLKTSVVQIFPDEFKTMKRATLRLANEAMFDGKAVLDFEVVASSFGLLAVLFRQQAQKNSFHKDQRFSRLKEFLNGLDFSALLVEHETFTRGTPFPQTTPSTKDQHRPRIAQKLTMPAPQTPPVKGESAEHHLQNSTPNTREIYANFDKLLITKRGQQLISECIM